MKKISYFLFLCFFTVLVPRIAFSDVLPCGKDDASLGGKETQVVGESDIYEGPGEENRKIINKKTSEIMGKVFFHQVDESTVVKCSRGDWTYIKISEPSWLSHVEGWVKSSVLLSIVHDDKGNRIYREENFHWDDVSKKYKKDMVDAMNFLYESGLCKGIHCPFPNPRAQKSWMCFILLAGKGYRRRTSFSIRMISRNGAKSTAKVKSSLMRRGLRLELHQPIFLQNSENI